MKNKDAAGLGSLAHAAAEGDATAIEQALEPVAVKIVAAGLKRPAAFFKWALAECSSDSQATVVLAAQHFLPRASWPWDKAFLAAGAYLSCQNEVPKMPKHSKEPQVPFPYWIAVDKHTPQGKIALRSVASTMRISEYRLQWASFYFESGKTQEMLRSLWWECETEWRFSKLGLSVEEAGNIWTDASPYIELAVQEQTELLLNLVEHTSFKFFL